MTRKIPIVLAGLVLVLALGAGAARADNGVRIDGAWARATPAAAKTGAIYLTITNTGSAPDTIESASTPAADKAELHEMKMENGVMEMRPVRSLTVAAGKSVVLQPGGYHLMLTGLKAPLKEGQTVPVTVIFKHAGAQQVTVSVAKIGAMHAGDMSTGSAGSAMPSGKSDMSDMPGMQH
ncbi:MAG: copper chaperone PCu(A)C [Stellaceae bacterium]